MSKEKNQSYEIIVEMSCNDQSIVLGHSLTAPSPYVTWWTTPDRKYGFESGHYFNNFDRAYSDLSKRSHELLNKQLNYEKQKDRGAER